MMKTITLRSYNRSSLAFSKYCLESLLAKHRVPYCYCTTTVRTHKISLLKSPHVYKKFKEHYVQTEHILKLQITANNKQFASFLPLLNLNRNSVSFEIK